MKKLLVATSVAFLALASVAAAQGYSFSSNLTVGSTGSDVVALQTALIAAGFNIPSIASGAATKGYFGSQTQAAVKLYQAAHGVPNTGFVGPLTRAALNGSAAVVTSPVSITCPVGMVCTPIQGTTPVVTAPVGISTSGVAGTLAVSLWSTPSGVQVYKGQAYDVATYKLQAGASDMAVTNFSVDFSDRLWLYANTITLKDETGAVVGTLNNLNASNFSELTVGADYRVSVPASVVVRAAQSKYITVNVAFNAISDRTNTTLNVVSAQIRSVDGTGVTDTETVSAARAFTYNGSNIGQVYVTTDPNAPTTGLQQISTSVQTQNVLLGIFDIKSANEASTLQSLTLKLNTSKANITSLFSNIQIKMAGLTYSASTINTTPTTVGPNDTNASSTIQFTNLQIPLSADVYTPVSVYATVAADTQGLLAGTSASTTLVAYGSGSVANPSIIDATYNNLVVNAASIKSNDQTFTASGVTIPSLSTSYGTKSCDTGLTTCNQTFAWSFTLQAGNNPIYLSSNVATALATSTISGLTFKSQDFSDSNTSGDGTGYFYIAPGQSKTFTATYQVSGPSSVGGNTQVLAIQYGTATSATGSYLQTSDISNLLKAVLFH